MKARLKIVLAAAVVFTALAVLGVLYAGARLRALLSYCRNNLRHLGGLAVRNWENLNSGNTGRHVWQEIRDAQYRSLDGTKWSVPAAEPFTCPLLGRGHADPADPGSIDYMGPRTIRPSARETPRAEPIGADRPGNHPSGGLVLRLDTSVDSLPPAIDEAKGDAWEEVRRALKD